MDYEKWKEIARQNGIKDFTFRARIKRGYTLEEAAMNPKSKHIKKNKNKNKNKQNDIAMYIGDEFFIWGTQEEVAEKLGKSVKQVKWLCYPSVRKRLEERENALYGIFIEDDDDT
ncbi:hypothetical protein [Gracilibacillus sp. YIM 98692]|uniref:hypothetical protein n=1 Tax=Gracilibacillus sp. YIM 98692 TaxID=2663532 RepID=UPI0013CFFA39|nr:hypothetical protein [Gracilibacillus sp. YIM 98692]